MRIFHLFALAATLICLEIFPKTKAAATTTKPATTITSSAGPSSMPFMKRISPKGSNKQTNVLSQNHHWQQQETLLSNRGGGSKTLAKPGAGPKRFSLFVYAFGILLAFNSGFMNGSFLSGLLPLQHQQGVAAFTGSYTLSALALAEKNIEKFIFQLKMIGSYIIGGCISGAVTPYSKSLSPQSLRLDPMYGPTFLLAGIAVLCSMFFVTLDKGIEFSKTSNVAFYVSAIANGIQNGITSLYSSNLLRTTHLTGITSDIGTFTGQLLRGRKDNYPRLEVIVSLAIAFWLGGFASFYATQAFQGWTLLINASIFLLIGSALLVQLIRECFIL